MSFDIQISDALPRDFDNVEPLYQEAFPDEDLVPLVKELLAGREDVLSLSALVDGELVGHAVFTMCSIDGEKGGSVSNVALLGPIAVMGELQKLGIGSKLIREGFRRLTVEGIGQVFVLGDPNYYSRFEFSQDDLVAPPYPLPEKWAPAWRSIRLLPQDQAVSGTLSVPVPWQDVSLWA